jgi:hypothetical protein
MQKILLTLVAFILSAGLCYAQTGNNQVGIGAEANFLSNASYTAAYNTGFGGSVKGLYGVGTAGQITLTSGYSSFSSKSGTIYAGQTLSLIPIIAGYRYNFKGGFYGEPQAGMAILSTKVPGFSFSQTNFAAALNIGYAKNGFDVSARYYTEGDVVSMFAVRVGYNISLK